MDVKTMSVDSIGLSTRSRNALQRAGIHHVGDMLECTEESLTEIRHLGTKSIEEILNKIEEYRELDAAGGIPDETPMASVSIPESFSDWMQEANGKEYVISWLKKKAYQIDSLELLSVRAYNLLMLSGYTSMSQIAFLDESELMQIPRMDPALAGEIVRLCRHFLRKNGDCILGDYTAEQEVSAAPSMPTIFDILPMPEYHDAILNYVKANDKDVRDLGLSNRPVNCLLRTNLRKLSDIIFITKSELLEFPAMGKLSAEEILTKIKEYLSEKERNILAVCIGDASVLMDDKTIRNLILKQYQEIAFGGLNYSEMKERLQLPDFVCDERLKKVIGSLLASGEIEYVDYRLYRVYGKFSEYLGLCTSIKERSKDLIRKRLQGLTLDGIAQEYGLTRERVRQIVKKDAQKVCDWYRMTTGMFLFDEDYYRYFYSTYDFEKKDAMEWLGMTADICNYLDMMDVKRGEQNLQSALQDHTHLDAGLRLKIKNYLNRNKLFIDGMWVEKRRSDLEEVVVRKFCREDTSFDDFTGIYNAFLEQEEIPFDEDIYYTESVYRARKNRLCDARFLLWKQNERIRYYDVDGRDYTELLDTLNLEAYEDIEISTLKFLEHYPEILAKYDIRDQYELHNLLRKIIPEESYHDFHCERMPIIRFGTFHRDEAILDILMANAPISITDLCDRIHNEYGYDTAVIQANYLQPFAEYYHQGIYSIDQKAMIAEHRAALKAVLTEDFYFIDEIRKIYRRLFPEADMEEINPYNLKLMGFLVLSRYVVQNYASLEALCEGILTHEDVIDIAPYRKRFACIQMFSQKLMELKRNLQIVEYEPNQIIHFRRLERFGLTWEMVRDFYGAVYDFAEDGTYFSIQSLKQDGFESGLYDLGFSDWFYANLLISDDRFSSCQMFGNIIFYKGHEDITIRAFETERIREYGSIDTYDLAAELTNRYGCKIADRHDVIYKVRGTEIYYDKILDRLYANYDIYDRELDRTEGI